jgi:hypothetical protein
MHRSKIALPFSGGIIPERLLRNRGRLRRTVAALHVQKLRKALDALLRDQWVPLISSEVSTCWLSLTSWRPRLADLPLILITLLQQTLRPKEIVVWLTAEDHKTIAENLRVRFGELGIRFQICDNLKCHKKWLPMIEEGHQTPFVICDDDIIYPKEWFAALVAEDRSDAYVGAKCHRISIGAKGLIAPYSAWKKQIRTDGQPSHKIFVTGCGGAVIHPQRIPRAFLERAQITRHCPHADDVWLKAAHLAAGIPCYKTRYSFPCLELPGTNASGLAKLNVDNGGNDEQIGRVAEWFALISPLSQQSLIPRR